MERHSRGGELDEPESWKDQFFVSVMLTRGKYVFMSSSFYVKKRQSDSKRPAPDCVTSGWKLKRKSEDEK
jgi:hypothetical protein